MIGFCEQYRKERRILTDLFYFSSDHFLVFMAREITHKTADSIDCKVARVLTAAVIAVCRANKGRVEKYLILGGFNTLLHHGALSISDQTYQYLTISINI